MVMVCPTNYVLCVCYEGPLHFVCFGPQRGLEQEKEGTNVI